MKGTHCEGAAVIQCNQKRANGLTHFCQTQLHGVQFDKGLYSDFQTGNWELVTFPLQLLILRKCKQLSKGTYCLFYSLLWTNISDG